MDSLPDTGWVSVLYGDRPCTETYIIDYRDEGDREQIRTDPTAKGWIPLPELGVGGMNVGMSTHKIKGEDYYQCRDVKAERDKLLEEVLRLRVAMAKAAQRADDWPDSNDDPADVLSDCASILFDALDEDDCDENGECEWKGNYELKPISTEDDAGGE